MIRTVQGKVRGRTIEFDQDLDIADGQEVEVIVRTVSSAGRQAGEGLRRTEGALADDAEWDAIMDEIHRCRKQDRRAQAPELGEA